MEKIIKNKSLLLGLSMFVVFGFCFVLSNANIVLAAEEIVPILPPDDYVTAPAQGTNAPTNSVETLEAQQAQINSTTAVTPTQTPQDKSNPLDDSPSIWGGIGGVMAWIGNIFLSFFAFFLYVAASIFELAAKFSLTGWYRDMPIIKSAWAICRDLANVFFVFILLYISLGTILQLAGVNLRQMLVKTLLVAVFLNFSFTITGIIIDTSNVIAIEFYNKMSDDAGTADSSFSTGAVSYNGVTAKIMNGLQMTTIFKTSSAKATRPVEVIFGTIFGSVVIIILTCVFLIAAFMFAARTVTFLFLLILSPLAFAAMAIPGGLGEASEKSKEWWTKLTKNAIFAPAFMFLLYLVVEIINSKTIFTAMLNSTGTALGKDDGFGALATAAAGTTGVQAGTILIVLNYVIIVGLLIGVITIASSSGVAGAGMAVGRFNKLKGFAQGKASEYGKRASGAAASAVGLGRLPTVLGGGIVRGAEQKRIAATEAKITNRQKSQFAGRSNADLIRMAQPSRIKAMSTRDQAALIQQMGKQGVLNMNDPQMRSTVIGNLPKMRELGMDTGMLFNNTPELLSDPEVVRTLTPKDIQNLPERAVTSDFIHTLIQSGGNETDIQAVMSRGGTAADSLITELRTISGATPGTPLHRADLVRQLTSGPIRNPELAAWIDKNEAATRNLLNLV